MIEDRQWRQWNMYRNGYDMDVGGWDYEHSCYTQNKHLSAQKDMI